MKMIFRTGGLLLLYLLLSPAWAQDGSQPQSGGEEERAQLSLNDLRTFTDVFHLIRESYVEDIDDASLMMAAIRGMLDELDPHSSFLTEEQYRKLSENVRGEYGGIGIEANIQKRKIVVVSLAEEGPAARQGMQIGDVITSIDGALVKGRNLRRAMAQLRGKSGTQVELKVHREGISIPLEFSLTRENIKTPSISTAWLENQYGYIEIRKFQQDSATALKDAVKQLQNESGGLRGLVLDLRSNPGGVLNSAIGVADAFLEEGLITYTEGRAENAALEFSATPGDVLGGNPLVVLVGSRSASAAEIVAGALQDHQRAVLVGERTFGKGSVQSVLPMRNGSALKLTTSRYYTPNGRSIQAEGIDPDFSVEKVKVVDAAEQSANREADIAGHLSNTDSSSTQAKQPLHEVSATDDYALYQALNLLKGVSILSKNSHADPDTEN